MYGYGYSLYNQVPFGRGGIDPAAAAYFASTGITGATQQTAIDNLVKGLKQDGLWSKMKAVYPFVTDNKNLLSYTNTLTQTSYWNQVSVTLTGNQTDPVGGTNATRIVGTGAASLYGLISLTVGATYTLSCYVKSTSGSNQTFRIYANGGSPFSPNLTATSTWQQVTLTFTAIAGTNSFGITRDSSTNNFDILAYGIQMEAGSTATTYQPIATTQQAFISSQFKYNLVNPVDSDAAFRLVFNGGWTHSANGATPNGTNGYADTKFSANANQTVNNCSVSAYVRTSTNASTSVGEFGAAGAVAFLPLIALQSTTLTTRNQYCWDYNAGSGAADINTSDSSGMWGVSRSSASSWQSFERNVAISKTTNTTQSSLPTANIYIGAVNNNGTAINFSFRQIAFAHMGNSLTNSEFNNLYTRVQAFQTALNRQV